MQKVLLNDTDINILVKKSRGWFWFGLIVLSVPVIGFSIGFVDALMYDSERLIYPILMLSALLASLILFLVLLIKANPGAIRKKYSDGSFKIIQELSIKETRSSKHGRMDPTQDSSIGNSAYSLYYMTLSNDKEYSIEYNEYIDIQQGRIKSAKLETAEKNGKLISVRVIKSSSDDGSHIPDAFYRSSGGP
ncbi:MAG: hypothetical protein Q8M29_03760 [Bacteroidota bacterium]|nr:hypothetical protein [Bacteroidota bacterium]